MSATLKRIHEDWMKLEPSRQYMFWTVFGIVLSGGLLLALSMIVPMVSGEQMPYLIATIAVGILLLSGIFVSAIIFLTVIWPHRYEAFTEQKE